MARTTAVESAGAIATIAPVSDAVAETACEPATQAMRQAASWALRLSSSQQECAACDRTAAVERHGAATAKTAKTIASRACNTLRATAFTLDPAAVAVNGPLAGAC